MLTTFNNLNLQQMGDDLAAICHKIFYSPRMFMGKKLEMIDSINKTIAGLGQEPVRWWHLQKPKTSREKTVLEITEESSIQGEFILVIDEGVYDPQMIIRNHSLEDVRTCANQAFAKYKDDNLKIAAHLMLTFEGDVKEQ